MVECTKKEALRESLTSLSEGDSADSPLSRGPVVAAKRARLPDGNRLEAPACMAETAHAKMFFNSPS